MARREIDRRRGGLRRGALSRDDRRGQRGVHKAVLRARGSARGGGGTLRADHLRDGGRASGLRDQVELGGSRLAGARGARGSAALRVRSLAACGGRRMRGSVRGAWGGRRTRGPAGVRRLISEQLPLRDDAVRQAVAPVVVGQRARGLRTLGSGREHRAEAR